MKHKKEVREMIRLQDIKLRKKPVPSEKKAKQDKRDKSAGDECCFVRGYN